MRSLYSTHGKHCYLRSFQAKCPKCGVDVLYWECNHGCKVFFEYPPYGKLLKHICRRDINKNRKKKYTIIVKKPKKFLENASPSCPVCGKLFKTENDVKEHMKQIKKTDDLHKNYNSDFLFENFIQEKNKDFRNKLKFGRINLKKRNL